MSSFFSNSSEALKQLKRNIKLWKSGKKIQYKISIKNKKKPLYDFLLGFYPLFSSAFVYISLVIIFDMLKYQRFDLYPYIQGLIKAFNHEKVPLSVALFAVLIMNIYSAVQGKITPIKIYISKNKIIVKQLAVDRILWFMPINIPFNGNQYLPEIELPEKEMEEHQHLCQELQQAISLETGLKFDTQKFLEENKDKLKLRV